MSNPLRSILLVASKDLLIELRTRVFLFQIIPFAATTLALLGFALDADRSALRSFSPGLFWLTVLLASLLGAQRAVSVERSSGTIDALRLSGVSASLIFAGKTLAQFLVLLILEALMLLGIAVLYDAGLEKIPLGLATAVVATLGIASAGTLYGVLAAGSGVRETLLPMLLLPVFAPVLIAASRATGDALGTTAVNGWAWFGLTAGYSGLYAAGGALAYGPLMETDS